MVYLAAQPMPASPPVLPVAVASPQPFPASVSQWTGGVQHPVISYSGQSPLGPGRLAWRSSRTRDTVPWDPADSWWSSRTLNTVPWDPAD